MLSFFKKRRGRDNAKSQALSSLVPALWAPRRWGRGGWEYISEDTEAFGHEENGMKACDLYRIIYITGDGLFFSGGSVFFYCVGVHHDSVISAI
jgi:hypothetical protein